ncbi:transposase [Planctomycetota bacterium]
MVTNYIGADVDCKMTELAVERKGKIIARDRVPTDIKSLSNFLRSISGQKVMVIEEGPMAGWLYRNLRTKVDRFVVCDPRRNKLISCDGEKDDTIDAGDLAVLLRGGYLREVYHTDDEDRLALKEIVALYHDRVRDAVRQINKLRGYGRGHGIRIPGRIVENPSLRGLWLKDLKPAIAQQLSIMWIGFDAVAKQVRMAKKEMSRRSKAYPIIGFWQDLPGIGLVRAVTLFAYLDCPWRFGSPKKLWKYCGIGLKRFTSGSDKLGRPKPGNLRLFRHTNRRLKGAIMGAALSATGQLKNPFADHYWRMIRNGVTAGNARHTVARKMLTTMWGMWKTNCRYEESLV